MFYSLIMKCKKNIKILFLLLFSFVFLNGCNPNTSETTIYTSDVEEVKKSLINPRILENKVKELILANNKLKFIIKSNYSLHNTNYLNRILF